MKYQVGDRVRIVSRERAQVLAETPGCPMVDGMVCYAGQEAEVRSADFSSYKLDVDHEMFWWNDDCLEPDPVDSLEPVAEEEFLSILF